VKTLQKTVQKSVRKRFLVFAAALAAALAIPAGAAMASPRPHHHHVLKKTQTPADGASEHLSHGRFKDVAVYRPKGEPKSFVLFLSGDGGWNLGVVQMAQMLATQGAMVVGINTPKLLANFDRDDGDCVFPDGDLENLSHFVQAYYRLPEYLKPILVGYSSGATFAYAVLAQAPKDTFAGALSLGFGPELQLHKPMCKGSGVAFRKRADGKGVDFLPTPKLSDPWIVLQGEIDKVCAPAVTRQFVSQVTGAEVVMLPHVGHGYGVPAHWQPQFEAAFAKLAASEAKALPPPPPSALGDLPVVELAATPGRDSDLMAVLMTGDGGWAGLDQDVAHALAAQGIPVVALDSLRYYWTARTPAGAAADVDRLIRYYLAHWHKRRALLVGYSQGADVLPFILNRLPAATRGQVALGAMMGLSDHAVFEFHLANWVKSVSDEGLPTLPEVRKISGTPLLCVYGKDEDDSLCPQLDPHAVKVVELSGGHHFGGDYQRLAQEILAAAHS
jgi:type IV secretory pathway VirJ component